MLLSDPDFTAQEFAMTNECPESPRPVTAHRWKPSMSAWTVAATLLIASMNYLAAQPSLTPVATEWNVQSDFEKSAGARTNLSGAACAPTQPELTSCLIANDDKKYAQFFAINGTTLIPGKVIRLLDDDAEGNPDAEGVAYSAGYFYVTGSHGRSRNTDEDNDASYVVFRFPVDERTGEPTFNVSDKKVVDSIEPSKRLRDAIRNSDKIGSFYNQPLSEGGINVEGVAVKDGRIYLGLRGPSVNEHAFIVSVDAEAAFTKNDDLKASTPQSLKLGKDAGIRDLASVQDGILVLSGPVNKQPVRPAIFHWNENTEVLRKLGELQLPASLPDDGEAKAEILLVLEDKTGEPWRVLVMFDGPENGAPTEYLVPR
jgi:hypothetical protein